MVNHPSLDPKTVRFVADRMLGRLARMLRLLGYDTIYEFRLLPAQLAQRAQREDRILLTRGSLETRFREVAKVVSLQSESPPQQLRELVERLSLDTERGLWSRCTLCNGEIQHVEKKEVEHLVEPKVCQIYQEFFRCAGCGHIYWRGSHVDRTIANLATILGKPLH